jgi:LysM repeat protein
MDQISKTVNTFLSYIVGIGLICFFSFVFLLASARLNNSTLGGLLAQSAGETAKMARSESFSFWGQVGQQVASGLGVSSIGIPATPFPLMTPQPTTPPAGPTSPPATQAPTQSPTTQAPTTYISRSGLSDGGLLRWQGLEADGQTFSPMGVSLETVRNQAEAALQQNAGDMLGAWLLSKYKACEPDLAAVRGNWADVQQVPAVIQGAENIINKCNARVYEAYAVRRWAMLTRWGSVSPDKRPEDDVPNLMAGLRVFIGTKVDGAARANNVRDHVTVTFETPGFNLPGNTITVTIGTVNKMMGTNLGDTDGWKFGTTAIVPHNDKNFLFPDNPPAVIMPTDAELTPPAAQPAAKAVQPNVQPTQAANPGQYTVQSGDTVYAIARKFGVAVDALIAANPSTLGYNPNYITPGMVLNIPAP